MPSLAAQVTEIISLAHAADFPVVFALNMRKLGKALGKTIRVSAVAVYRRVVACFFWGGRARQVFGPANLHGGQLVV